MSRKYNINLEDRKKFEDLDINKLSINNLNLILDFD